MDPGSVLEAVLTVIQCRGLSDYLLWQENLRKALEESSWGQVLNWLEVCVSRLHKPQYTDPNLGDTEKPACFPAGRVHPAA